MNTYTATATRDGRWWTVQCDQVPQAISQVARLEQAEEVHREAIAFVTDVPDDQVSVTVRAALPNDVQQQLENGREQLADGTAIVARARANLRSAAIRMRTDGMNVRDIGWLLGISHQRAQQLTTRPPMKSGPPAAVTTEAAPGTDQHVDRRAG